MKPFLAVLLPLLLAASALGQVQPVTVVVAPDSTGPDLSPRFAGISYESAILLPQAGKYYFDSQNPALLSLFRTLGIRSLRIGGNSADDPNLPLPQPSDIYPLFDFAKATGATVIYSFPLFGPFDETISMARNLVNQFPGQLDALVVGNEPDFLVPDYDTYRTAWKPFYDALTASVPEARLAGPCVARDPSFAVPFAKEFGPGGKISFIGVHHYYLGNGPLAAQNPAAARETFLSDEIHARYQASYDAVGQPVFDLGLYQRFDETNSCSHGGAPGASDTYAATLWALDYMHWWAAHGLLGMNFHNTADYALFVPRKGNRSFEIRPISYALLAFRLGAQGRSLPVAFDTGGKFNFDAYGFLLPDGTVSLTLINKSHAPVAVSLQLPPSALGAAWKRIDLAASGGNVAATEGIACGGAPIRSDGSWSGKWKAADVARPVVLPPASALILVGAPASIQSTP